MDATTPPDPAPLSPGRRIRYWRERRGMTREVLGGLVGKSASWVKAVETDRLQPPRLPTLLRIAEVLHIRNLADLTGDQSIPIRMFTGPGHAALPQVRAAINDYTLTASGPPPNPAHLRARLARSWAARHSAPDHRTVLGGILPDLLRDAQHLARATQGTERRAAHAILAEAYNLSQFYLAYQPAPDLLWRVAERAMLAAQESEDPATIAGAAWLLAQAHRDAGDWDAADHVNLEALRMLEPLAPDADTGLAAMAGALHFEAAYTAAKAGRSGDAWRCWDKAKHIADHLPPAYYHPMTSFSRIIMGAHALTVDVELRNVGESVRLARRIHAELIPSQPRRGRHLIEAARAHYLGNDMDSALRTLEDAYTAAPETIRYNGYARRIVLELLEDGAAPLRHQAELLAGKVGLLD
ncbi:MAG TPA: helix-turn-helix transcriptional regulator [Streptosporangiaceae bacterium]|nr:helix-turn-helix transcriptional regulator [Streptosporangiaceae bacterium]